MNQFMQSTMSLYVTYPPPAYTLPIHHQLICYACVTHPPPAHTIDQFPILCDAAKAERQRMETEKCDDAKAEKQQTIERKHTGIHLGGRYKPSWHQSHKRHCRQWQQSTTKRHSAIMALRHKGNRSAGATASSIGGVCTAGVPGTRGMRGTESTRGTCGIGGTAKYQCRQRWSSVRHERLAALHAQVEEHAALQDYSGHWRHRRHVQRQRHSAQKALPAVLRLSISKILSFPSILHQLISFVNTKLVSLHRENKVSKMAMHALTTLHGTNTQHRMRSRGSSTECSAWFAHGIQCPQHLSCSLCHLCLEKGTGSGQSIGGIGSKARCRRHGIACVN
eukprot:1145109-Pelagomonas_calceolata.AAC.3